MRGTHANHPQVLIEAREAPASNGWHGTLRRARMPALDIAATTPRQRAKEIT
jgi:hypothetical protein